MSEQRINDGGPAFPQALTNTAGGFVASHEVEDGSGMSLRDYFAAKAMQGIISECESSGQPYTNEQLAQWAYAIADAMIAERSKGGAS